VPFAIDFKFARAEAKNVAVEANDIPQGAEQAPEKRRIRGEIPEKHASGVKACVDSIAFVPGINPRPTA
jgi:hypothetical protein